MKIKVYDGNRKPLCDVTFIDNLTREGVPDYVNMNCRIGITEYPGARYEGWYVLMYYDTYCPSRSYGELLSPEEAYDELERRGRHDLIDEFDIHFERQREVL